MNYAKKQRLFFSLRKNSLTLDLSSHHQNSFRFLTISFNFLKFNVPKYSQINYGKKNCRGKRIGQVTFPTMCSNIPAKNTILPLGYHCNIKPDNTKKCNLPGCNISTPNESWSILTGCFHSFHCKCLDESTSCLLCKDFLQKKVQELGEIAKEAILHSHATDTDDDNESTTASMTDSTGDEENYGVREMEKEEYENLIEKLNNELANVSPPPQPSIASHVNQRLSQNTSCNSTGPSAPPHCSKCHHPVRSRENNSVTKCN